MDARTLTRTEQIMETIRDRIERRVLTPGAAVPSVRAMAEASGFSKSTVVEAYDRLVADGLIRSRPGSGFFVAAPLAPLSLERIGPQKEDREVDSLWMLRQSLAQEGDLSKPGSGWLPDGWLANLQISKALRAAARQNGRAPLTGYSSPLGLEKLRRIIAHRQTDLGIAATPDQILLTDSSTHSLDLVCRYLLEPGDTVLVDDPCYFNFLAFLRAHRVNVLGIPMTPTGPDLAAFAQALSDSRTRLYLTNSAVHNPTGASLSLATAHRLLKLAAEHDLVIVEDDIFADFEDEPTPRLAALDGLDRVIRIGSFSKSVTATIKCGFICARGEWIEGLTDLRIATGMSGSPLAAEVIHTVLTDGSYRRHMEGLRTRLARERAHTLSLLRDVGVEPWTEPSAGIFIWAKLPNGLDAAALARSAYAQGVVLAPGNVFSTGGLWSDYLRINVAFGQEPRFAALLKGLASREA